MLLGMLIAWTIIKLITLWFINRYYLIHHNDTVFSATLIFALMIPVADIVLSFLFLGIVIADYYKENKDKLNRIIYLLPKNRKESST